MKYFIVAIIVFTVFGCRKDKVQEIIPVEEECPEERSFSRLECLNMSSSIVFIGIMISSLIQMLFFQPLKQPYL